MDAIEAVTELLRPFEIDQPRSIFEIGVPLVGQGYAQDQLVNALFFLRSQKKFELLDGNRVRVISLL